MTDTTDTFTPLDIRVDNNDEQMLVAWKDGHETTLPVSRLRGYCPCAECQGHGGALTYIDNEVRGISNIEMVGRYAILIVFADGHDTGIFRWDYLRRLDPSELARWGAPERMGERAPVPKST